MLKQKLIICNRIASVVYVEKKMKQSYYERKQRNSTKSVQDQAQLVRKGLSNGNCARE